MHQTQWSAESPLPPPVSLTSQSHHEKPPEVTCTRRGNPGFPASTRESPRETSFNTLEGRRHAIEDAAVHLDRAAGDVQLHLLAGLLGREPDHPVQAVRDALE